MVALASGGAAERKDGRHRLLASFFPCNANRVNVKISHSRGLPVLLDILTTGKTPFCRCPSRQPIFSPRSAHAQPIFGAPQIELKLTPHVGHHTSSPPLEAFGVTTNGLAYRGQQRSGGQILHSGLWPPHMSWSAKKGTKQLARTPSCFSTLELTSQGHRLTLRHLRGLLEIPLHRRFPLY